MTKQIFDLNDPIELRAQTDLDLLNEHTGDKYTVGYEEEYICLYINGRRITSGCIEVPERLHWLVTERGLQYYEGH
jgi:hypothetical protein